MEGKPNKHTNKLDAGTYSPKYCCIYSLYTLNRQASAPGDGASDSSKQVAL